MFKEYLKQIYNEGTGENVEEWFYQFLVSDLTPQDFNQLKPKPSEKEYNAARNCYIAAKNLKSKNLKAELLGKFFEEIKPIWKNIFSKLRLTKVEKLSHPAKTDIKINDKKISIKYGKARLMSGTEDAIIVLWNAGIKSQLGKEKIERLANELWEIIDKKISTQNKDPKDISTKDQKKLDNHMQLAQDWFEKNVGNLLDNNEKFKKEIIKESLTGLAKFGETSNASANYLLTIDEKSNIFKYHLAKINTRVINIIAKVTDITLGWKSGSRNSVKTGFIERISSITLQASAKVYTSKERASGSVVPGYIAQLEENENPALISQYVGLQLLAKNKFLSLFNNVWEELIIDITNSIEIQNNNEINFYEVLKEIPSENFEILK